MSLRDLLENNRRWAEATESRDPGYFKRLKDLQEPEYLWIGCSDSRVPANQIVDLHPGELFVHRNVANLVVASDLNLLSVLQYAVQALPVRHIIVCGHYNCGGVRAALRRMEMGLIDNWLQPLRHLYADNRDALDSLATEDERVDRLCELNVVAQTRNVAETTIVQDAWAGGRDLAVHGWIYGLADGRLRDLGCTMNRSDQLDPALRMKNPQHVGSS